MEFLEEREEDNNFINEDVLELNNLWRTEANSPEILPFKQQIIEEITSLLHQQQSIIEERVSNPDEVFTATLYQMDIERVRYSLSRYLRTRIIKIQNLLPQIISNNDIMNNLSKHEKLFATKLHNLNHTYYTEAFYNRLSENIKESIENSDDCLKNTQILYNNYVFCHVVKDITHVDVGDGSIQNFLKNEMFIAKYIFVREYVLEGKIHLL